MTHLEDKHPGWGVVRLLALLHPLPGGITLAPTKCGDLGATGMGRAHIVGGVATITIDRRIVEQSHPSAFLLVYAHEYAHILAHRTEGAAHSTKWGEQFAKCWRALTLENNTP